MRRDFGRRMKKEGNGHGAGKEGERRRVLRWGMVRVSVSEGWVNKEGGGRSGDRDGDVERCGMLVRLILSSVTLLIHLPPLGFPSFFFSRSPLC